MFCLHASSGQYYVNPILHVSRYILTALALNDLVTGLFVTVFGIYPSLFECWPLGEEFCQIQVRIVLKLFAIFFVTRI